MTVMLLLKKDWITYRKTLVWSGIYLLVFSFCFRGLLNVQGTYIYAIMLAAYMGVGASIQGDERNRVDHLLRVLPIRPEAVPLAKFVLADVIWLGGLLVFTLLGLGCRMWRPFFVVPALSVVGISFFATSLVSLVMIPMTYRFGSERGRILLIVITFCFFGLMGAGLGVASTLDLENMNRLWEILEKAGWLWGVLGLGAGLALQLLGWRIACGIYKKREV